MIPVLAELTANPFILDHVESLIGPDIPIWGCELFIKEPHTDKIVSWHQGMTSYWGLGEEANGDTEHLVSAWFALSPATVQSGCMRFVAWSHGQDIVEHVDTFHAGCSPTGRGTGLCHAGARMRRQGKLEPCALAGQTVHAAFAGDIRGRDCGAGIHL